ncbi:MAG: rod shape-determining protein [Candidatus Woykebacteria bacterium RBG_16_43_9]|uniref:Cell shape-determining protein MreB n=1 Tax=Candidatus Woykebacteria bacterium RBG_16_43_9 TaxID=1802596 RepID=A0A1G1WER9_9BACT|nr:MAG: rod shape-determining protein [Candidatus Woykebacteria bacterium RBG_16_43_9]
MDLNPLNHFWGTFSHDIAIDLGTKNTKVAVLGKGVAIREPTVVAAHRKTKQIFAIGTEAQKMLGRTPATIVVKHPIQDGVIDDLDLTENLLKHFIIKVHQNPSSFPKIPRPKIAMGVPSGATEVERRAVSDAAANSGAREVMLIEEPMAAALGTSLPIEKPSGSMIVDIGAGTTEVAVISLGGLVVSKSLRIAGNEIDEDIINYARTRYNLLLGETTAEDVKIKAGSAYPIGKESKILMRGRDLAIGLPASVSISTGEVREAISNTLRSIVQGIKDVIEESPPELVGDIVENGIYLTGGSSLLNGLTNLISKETKIPVVLVDDPLSTVVKGMMRVLEDPGLQTKVKFAGSLKSMV